ALRESEERSRTLVEQSPFGISLIDKDGRYQYLNPKFKEMFGYGLEDIPTGKEWFQKAYPEEEYRRQVVKTWKEDQRNIGAGEARPRTYSVICKDGQKKVIHFRPVTMENGDQLVFHEDVTETEILEKQLRRVHKAEAVATLTGGIAHDYNNLVSIIMGNLGLARQEAETGTDLADFIKEASRATDKVRDLTHELMALSRGGAPVKEVGSLKPVLKNSAKIIPAESGILIEESIKEDLWAVPHDPHKLDAVFRNVLTNAVEAMPQGGTITIAAENLRIDDLDQDLGFALKAGDYVKITIGDDGRGIPEEHMDKLFDPYFSTKPMGVQKGMGLELATAHAIVQKHEGHIAVNSTPGVGTTVSIYLPGAEKEASKEDSEKSELTSGSKARILVMDDEEMLRNLTQQMLPRLGYEIKTVKDGVEAIEVYRTGLDSHEPFDAVILDLTVRGGMEGEQTIQELVKIDPDIKAIASSGYFNDPVMADFEKYGFKAAMAKPYDMKDLKETLEKVL
ncbi:MAG: ATP-binding protein, partial [Desulfatiglandaceae bacterium]